MDPPNKRSEVPSSLEEIPLTEENMACEGHLATPYPCENCKNREKEGFDVPCLKAAKTAESFL